MDKVNCYDIFGVNESQIQIKGFEIYEIELKGSQIIQKNNVQRLPSTLRKNISIIEKENTDLRNSIERLEKENE
jgi:hypothetical protein